MKTIIIRKPKFLRDDNGMSTYLNIAKTISKEACRPELTTEQRIALMSQAGECINDAAKAGGFRNVSDMGKWMARQITT